MKMDSFTSTQSACVWTAQARQHLQAQFKLANLIWPRGCSHTHQLMMEREMLAKQPRLSPKPWFRSRTGKGWQSQEETLDRHISAIRRPSPFLPPRKSWPLAPVSWDYRGLHWSRCFLLRREEASTTTCCKRSSTAITSEAILPPTPSIIRVSSLCLQINVTSAYVAIHPGLPMTVGFMPIVRASHMVSAHFHAQRVP